MKNIILISDGKQQEFDNLNELKSFMVPNITTMSKMELEEYLYEKIFGFCMLNDLQIIETSKGVYGGNFEILQENKNIDRAVIIDNIDTYILSLCKYNVMVLLEEVNNRTYTKNIEISNKDEKYIAVNTYADEILKELVGEK